MMMLGCSFGSKRKLIMLAKLPINILITNFKQVKK